MIELPEAVVLAGQINAVAAGKRIARAVAGASPHKFAWFTGDPAVYSDRLAGKAIGRAAGVGGTVEIDLESHVLAIGAPIRYHLQGQARPVKHQLLLELEDGTALSATAQMWGGFFCFPRGEKAGSIDYDCAKERPSPLTDAFDRAYFDSLLDAEARRRSAKAFLATEQRIPGLGNGALQDILWTARIHPKRTMGTLSDAELGALFRAVKTVLAAMAEQGGRDTERDLFGKPGGYATVLSNRTVGQPCPACRSAIRKEAYLGGAIYSCPECQKA